MTHWDRKELLRLVDEASAMLESDHLSPNQRHGLRALIAHYGDKAKSITASPHDVLSLQGQLSQLLDTNDAGT